MNTLVGLHSLWRWVVLLVMVVALVRGLLSWLRGGAWTGADRRLFLLATTAIDLQVVFGLVLYVAQRSWGASVFIAYVHPLIMLVALAVVHIFGARAKRASTPTVQYRTLALGFALALFLVTAAIPAYSWSRAWYA